MTFMVELKACLVKALAVTGKEGLQSMCCDDDHFLGPVMMITSWVL